MWTSCVYKLTINNETYVGSTGDFKKRLRSHKSSCYNTKCKEYNFKLYKYIREHSHWDNVKFEFLVHLHPKFNKVERCSFEQEWIDYIKPTLNKWSSNTGLSKKEWSKQWYIENKDKFSDKRKQKFNCECGGKYTHSHKSQHLKTKKHLEFIESKKTSLPHLPTEIIDKINKMAREMEIQEYREFNRAVRFNTCIKWIEWTMDDRSLTGYDEDDFNFFEFLQEIEFLR